MSVAVEPTALDLGAANVTVLNATVTNDNPSIPGQVVVSVEAPAGWTAEASLLQGPLAAGASQDFTITLTAPEAGAGAATGELVVTATITESAATARTETGRATVALTRVDPAPPPPPPAPWYETPGGIAAIVLAALLVAGLAAAAVVLRSRRLAREAAEAEAARRAAEEAAHRAYLARETGISLALLDGPRKYGPKRELTYRLQIENVSDRPRVAIVAVAETTPGWTAAVSIPRMPLSPGERAVVTLYANPDDAIASGEPARLVVSARPEEAQERDERVTISSEAPSVRVPLEGSGPASRAPRVNANQREPRS